MFVSLHQHLSGPSEGVGTLACGSGTNTFLGTRQILMHEKACMIPILAPFLDDVSIINKDVKKCSVGVKIAVALIGLKKLAGMDTTSDKKKVPC